MRSSCTLSASWTECHNRPAKRGGKTSPWRKKRFGMKTSGAISGILPSPPPPPLASIDTFSATTISVSAPSCPTASQTPLPKSHRHHPSIFVLRLPPDLLIFLFPPPPPPVLHLLRGASSRSARLSEVFLSPTRSDQSFSSLTRSEARAAPGAA